MPLVTQIDVLDYQKNVKTVGTLPGLGQANSAGSLPVVLPTDLVLPLPTGAATSAKQDTANTALTSLDSKIPVKGLTTASASIPVVLPSDGTLPLPTGAATSAKQDSLITGLGAPADGAASTDAGTFSLLSFVKRGLLNWTTLLARIPALVSGRIPVDGSGVVQPIAAQLTYSSSGISPLSNGQTTGFQATNTGELKVAVSNSNPDGQTNMANSAPVVIASDQSPITVGGISGVVAGSFNRPANTTAYASGQLIANSTTAGSVTPVSLAVARSNGGTGVIRRGRLTKSNTSITNASFRAHFYKSAPTPANGDGGALTTDQALTYIGSMDFDMTGTAARAFSDGVKCISVPNVGSDIVFDTNSGVTTIYALIEARANYTPASAETFTLALEVLKD